MTRAEGEIVRLRHAIARLRATLDSVEITLASPEPPNPGGGQAVAHAGTDIACGLARLAAYRHAEGDA